MTYAFEKDKNTISIIRSYNKYAKRHSTFIQVSPWGGPDTCTQNFL